MLEPPIRSHELLEQLIREQQATRKAVEHLAYKSDLIEKHAYAVRFFALVMVFTGLAIVAALYR